MEYKKDAEGLRKKDHDLKEKKKRNSISSHTPYNTRCSLPILFLQEMPLMTFV